MIVEIGDMTKVKIMVAFGFGVLLGAILSSPRTISNECITYDGIIYCNEIAILDKVKQ